jgi:hypothetical protein
MARCQCGGSQCNCVVQAGDNTVVTGSGSTANPYEVSAVTNCAEVRQCLSNGSGITYNPATGQISVDLSEDAGNNLVRRPNGLYVPTGSATVSTGCGLTGDGSGGSPVRVNSATWPHTCAIATNGGNVYCDTVSGRMRTDPPFRSSFRQASVNELLPSPRTVPSTETVVDTLALQIPNPDPCRPAFALLYQEVDVIFNLPADGGAASSAIGADDVNYLRNTGSGAINLWHSQHSVMSNLLVPAGGTTTHTMQITLNRGAGGATYTRIQANVRAWLFSIPQE